MSKKIAEVLVAGLPSKYLEKIETLGFYFGLSNSEVLMYILEQYFKDFEEGVL